MKDSKKCSAQNLQPPFELIFLRKRFFEVTVGGLADSRDMSYPVLFNPIYAVFINISPGDHKGSMHL